MNKLNYTKRKKIIFTLAFTMTVLVGLCTTPLSLKLTLPKTTSSECTPTVDTILPYLTKSKKYKLFNITNRSFVNNEEYAELRPTPTGDFIVSKYGRFGVIKNNGASVIPAIFTCIRFQSGFYITTLNESSGVYDQKGNKIFEPEYDNIQTNSDSILLLTEKMDGREQMLYSAYAYPDGFIFRRISESITVCNANTFILTENNQSVLVDRNRKPLTQKLRWISKEDENLFIATKADDKRGVINQAGNIIVPFIYDVLYANENVFVVGIGEKFGLLTKTGTTILPTQYFQIEYLKEGYFAVAVSKKLLGNDADANPYNFRLYDSKNMRFIGSETYDKIGNFSEGKCAVLKKNKMGYINNSGVRIIYPVYENNIYNEGGDCGEGEGDADYDETGCKPITEQDNACLDYGSSDDISLLDFCPFYASEFSNGVALVRVDTLYGYIKENGEFLIPPSFSYARPVYRGICDVQKYEDGKLVSHIYDYNGKDLGVGSILQYLKAPFNLAYFQQIGESNRGMVYVYDMSNNLLAKFEASNSLEFHNAFYCDMYKGKKLFYKLDGTALMDNNIDFAEYDFDEQLREVASLFYQQQYDEALRTLRKLDDKNPNNCRIFFWMAKCYHENKNNYYAKQYYDKSLALNPDNENAIRAKFQIHWDEKEWRDLIDCASKLIAKSTYTDLDLWFKRSYAYASINDEDNAFEGYSTIINNSPKSYHAAYNNRGIIYKKRRQFQLALSDFKNAIRICGDYDDTSKGLYYSNRGGVFYDLGRNSEACADWKKGAALGNSNCISNLRFCNKK